MPNFLISVDYFVRFVLVFFRLGGLFVFVPFFNHRVFSPPLKVVFALTISFITFPVLTVQNFAPPRETVAIILAVIRELMVGLVIGYAAQLLFTGVQFAGEMISFQMGLSLAAVIDPNINERSTLVSQLYNLFALLIFVSLGGHHFFIRAAIQTFDFVPLAGFHYSMNLGSRLLNLFGNIFIVAFRIGAPVLVTLFLTSAAMGLVSRAIPQMNVFMISPPLQIIVGLFMIIISLRPAVMVLKLLFSQLERDLQWLIANMAG
ncbi:MAG: flagellar biosynthetic protein FliR [Candidatus Poribacteria bacterium]|nr:flagellar biosynthetic protein FliR [Candidatus Poribacteria bacterium]